jgi:protein-tyrosine kinase
MNSDMNTPDLVRRAAARLSGAAGRAPVTELDTSMVRPVDAPIPLSPAVAKETADQLVREAPARPAPGGLHVNVSPTSLASNGISLPSNGFVRTVEEFRVIKRQVLSNVARAPMTPGSDLNRVIMITSAKPGDGKTYTAINLALSLAHERDLKVLLVDADVYRQSMMSYLGIKAEAGWIDLLADRNLTFSDVLLHTNIPNLSVLPAGKPHPEVPELMSSRRMGNLVSEMARRYPDRFIIFDTLPCLVSSEPAILASLVGQTIFVVAAHESSRDQIESSLRLINACPSVSLILNKADPVLTEQFGKYGYSYGYTYQK